MPELRKDPITGRWVIISTDRGKRPILRALGDCSSCNPCVDATNHDVNTMQPAVRVKVLGIPAQSRPQNRFSRLARTTDL